MFFKRSLSEARQRTIFGRRQRSSSPNTPTTVYLLHCTLYLIYCTLYIVPYKLYLIHCTLYRIHYTLYIIIVPYTSYLVPHTLYLIHCTLYIVPYTLYIVPCVWPRCYFMPAPRRKSNKSLAVSRSYLGVRVYVFNKVAPGGCVELLAGYYYCVPSKAKRPLNPGKLGVAYSTVLVAATQGVVHNAQGW